MSRDNDIRELLQNYKLSPTFQTIFEEEMPAACYSALFNATFSDKSDLRATRIPFVGKMNALGVILLGWDTFHTYLFTKTHLFVYGNINSADVINNKPAKFDGSDIWQCKYGDLKEIVPLSSISSIESEEGTRYSYNKGLKVQEEGNPVLGAVIGGAIAGSTGAVIGAIANSGKRERIAIPQSSTQWTKTRIILKTDQNQKYDMYIASTTKSSLKQQAELSTTDYGNIINRELSNGFRFSADSVINGSAAATVINSLSKHIETCRQEKEEREKAEEFWEEHSEEKAKLNDIIRFLKDSLNSVQDSSKGIRRDINNYVLDVKEKKQKEIDNVKHQINQSGFIKAFKLRKDLKALEGELESIRADKDFDDYMAVKINELAKVTQRGEMIGRMAGAFEKLEETISNKALLRYRDMIMDPNYTLDFEGSSSDNRDHTLNMMQDYLLQEHSSKDTLVRPMPSDSMNSRKTFNILCEVPARVFSIDRAVGDIVVKDEKVITIEALNMEIPLVSPQGGIIVSIDVSVGQHVDKGTIVATLSDDISVTRKNPSDRENDIISFLYGWVDENGFEFLSDNQKREFVLEVKKHLAIPIEANDDDLMKEYLDGILDTKDETNEELAQGKIYDFDTGKARYVR